MKVSNFFRAAIATCALAFSAHVNAAPILQVSSNGILTGAKGVTVNGTLYDVTFVDATCVAAFTGCDDSSDFTFTNFSDAFAAASALLNEVFIDGPAGSFDTVSSKVFGCSDSSWCQSFIPYELRPSNTINVAYATNYYGFDNRYDSTSWDNHSRRSDLRSYGTYNFAKFTLAAVAVPEPSSIALMGLAFTGLMFSRRRKS